MPIVSLQGIIIIIIIIILALSWLREEGVNLPPKSAILRSARFLKLMVYSVQRY